MLLGSISTFFIILEISLVNTMRFFQVTFPMFEIVTELSLVICAFTIKFALAISHVFKKLSSVGFPV